jgi:hypothetical protein
VIISLHRNLFCLLRVHALCIFASKTLTQVRDGTDVNMDMQGGKHVIVVKTTKQVFKFSHQDRCETGRWLKAFSFLCPRT